MSLKPGNPSRRQLRQPAADSPKRSGRFHLSQPKLNDCIRRNNPVQPTQHRGLSMNQSMDGKHSISIMSNTRSIDEHTKIVAYQALALARTANRAYADAEIKRTSEPHLTHLHCFRCVERALRIASRGATSLHIPQEVSTGLPCPAGNTWKTTKEKHHEF